jgi:hypothetical protein
MKTEWMKCWCSAWSLTIQLYWPSAGIQQQAPNRPEICFQVTLGNRLLKAASLEQTQQSIHFRTIAQHPGIMPRCSPRSKPIILVRTAGGFASDDVHPCLIVLYILHSTIL